MTLGSSQEMTRHHFSFAGLSAKSNLRSYSNSGDPWTFVGDTPQLEAEIAQVLTEFEPLPEGNAGQFYRYYALPNNTRLAMTLADSRASIELITSLYDSARSGQSIELPLTPDHPLYSAGLPEAKRQVEIVYFAAVTDKQNSSI